MISMNDKQKESTAKYLYDVSKGIALIAVVGNIVRGAWDIIGLVFGIVTSAILFIGAYINE